MAGVERAANRNPLFQIMLTHYVDEPGQTLSLPGVSATPLPDTLAAAKTDLDLSLADTPDGLAGFLTYATEILDRAKVDRFIQVFTAVLEAIATDPQQVVSGLSLVPELDRTRVSRWQVGQAGNVSSLTLDALVRRQTEATPFVPALIDDAGHQLSYTDFDSRVNAVAQVLVDQGVRVGDRVAVKLPRSVDLVITLAAVLRAGAAYVPIDRVPGRAGGRDPGGRCPGPVRRRSDRRRGDG